MKRKPDQITNLLSAFVHLTPEEIEGYLTKSLDQNVKSMVEEHLESCPDCFREVRLIWENITEEAHDSGPSHPASKGSVLRRIWVKAIGAKTQDSQVVLPLPLHISRYAKLWIGQRYFKLEPVVGQHELLEAKGLSVSRLLSARTQERKDPGTYPMAIEGPKKSHVLTSLTRFRPAGNFTESKFSLSEEFESAAPSIPKLKDLHMYSKKPSPQYESMSSKAPGEGRFASIRTPEPELTPELILTWENEAVMVHILRSIKTEKIFLRIMAKGGSLPHGYH